MRNDEIYEWGESLNGIISALQKFENSENNKFNFFDPFLSESINELEKFALDKLPICMAKTQYSLSDNPSLLGKPEGFDITVKEVRVSNGAGFIVVQTGDVMTMPGLPKTPAANKMDVLKSGEIIGLF